MPVYARADVMSVSIPRDSGGCGQTHTRPVVQGAAVSVWELNCPQCEQPIRKDIESSTVAWTDKTGKKHLINTSTWGDTKFRIPQTPDEASLTADIEHEAQKQMAATMQGLAAQVMAQHQTSRVAEVQQSVKADEASRAQQQITALQAQIEQLKQLVASTMPADVMHPPADVKVGVPISPEIVGVCPVCKGPSVRKHRKGPTPKCETCREGNKV